MTRPHGPWFVLVESNTTGSGRRWCAAARARGLRPVVLASDPSRYPYLQQDAVDVRALDTGDAGMVLTACRQLGKGAGLAGIASSSEYFAATAAGVACTLGLPAPDALALRRCQHKDRQRAALAAGGVAVPAFRAASDVASAVAAAQEIGLPVVVKPSNGSGSLGVRLCCNLLEVAEHTAVLLGTRVNERGLPVPRLVLVEEHVRGPELSVESFDTAIAAVVAKHLGPEPFFVETGHDVPAPVDAARRAAVATTAQRAVGALGVGWGAAHTELRVGSRGPVVIEVNPRLAGGMIPTLVQLAHGVDLIDAAVARASGDRPATSGRRHGHASIRFVVAPAQGTIVGIAGVDEARRAPGVVLVEMTSQLGAEVVITHSFRDRLGYVVATGDDARAAAERATDALSRIRVAMRQAA